MTNETSILVGYSCSKVEYTKDYLIAGTSIISKLALTLD